MSNPALLTFLKIVFTIALCIGFGFLYGQFIKMFAGVIDLSSRWVYIVLAVPVFLPIFEYIRTEYKHRAKFGHLIKEIVYTFIAALITISILVNFQFGDEFKDYIMSFIGLVFVILIANLINLSVNKVLKMIYSGNGKNR